MERIEMLVQCQTDIADGLAGKLSKLTGDQAVIPKTVKHLTPINR